MTAIVIGLAAVSLAGIGLALWYRARRLARVPKTWVQTGSIPPPAFAAEACQIIQGLAPGPVSPGGTVRWTTLPFLFAGRELAGVCVSHDPVEVLVGAREPVESTALAEEIGHAYWHQVYGRSGQVNDAGTGDATLDPDFIAWIIRVNIAIAAKRKAT